MLKMTEKEVHDFVVKLLKSKGNASLFSSMKIVSKPVLYANGGKNGMVQLKAIRMPGLFSADKYPKPLTFVMPAQPHGKKLLGLFKVGDVVNIIATADPYQGKVYGKRNMPIKYPDGSQRYTVKTRFLVEKMGRGINLYA